MQQAERSQPGERLGFKRRSFTQLHENGRRIAGNIFRAIGEPKDVARAMTEIGPAFTPELDSRLKTAPLGTLSLSGLQGKSVDEIAGMQGIIVIPSGASENEKRISREVKASENRKVDVVTVASRSIDLVEAENNLARLVTTELIERPQVQARFIEGIDELIDSNDIQDAVLGRSINPIAAEYVRFVADRLPEIMDESEGKRKPNSKKAHTLRNMGAGEDDSFTGDILKAAKYFLGRTHSSGETFREVFKAIIQELGDTLVHDSEIQERMRETGSDNVAQIVPVIDQIDLDTKATLLMMAMMSNAVRGVIKDPAGHRPRLVMRRHLIGEETEPVK